MPVYANVSEYEAARNMKLKRYPAKSGRGRGRPPKYPWKTTKVGGSFFVPDMLSCITHTTAQDVVFRDFKLLSAYSLGMKAVPGSRWSMANQYDGISGDPIGVIVTRVA